MNKGLFALLFIVISLDLTAQEKVNVLQVPGTQQFCAINESGVSILPSGRYVSPAGELLRITHDPFGMKLSPDGKKIISLHDGVFTLIDVNTMSAIRVPSYDNKIKSPFSKARRYHFSASKLFLKLSLKS